MNQVADQLLQKNINEEIIEMLADGTHINTSNINDSDASQEMALFISQNFINEQTCCLAFSTQPMSLFPGNYEIKYRLKVSDNSTSDLIATIYAGTRFAYPDFSFLGSKDVFKSEFNSVSDYQEFTFNFSLDDITHDIEFRLDLRDGNADLYADYITANNTTPVNLPVFAPLYMSLAVDPSEMDGMNRIAETFANIFEPGGGIILTPDEFMASLNPEFMISFSQNFLNPSDPGLIQAKQEFDNRDYFQSLLTIRSALASVAISNEYEEKGLPAKLTISQNYPNPFNPSTTIAYGIPETGEVTLEVFDVIGRKVATLLAGERKSAGRYAVTFDASNLASGIYIYRLRLGTSVLVRKLTLIKLTLIK